MFLQIHPTTISLEKSISYKWNMSERVEHSDPHLKGTGLYISRVQVCAPAVHHNDDTVASDKAP